MFIYWYLCNEGARENMLTSLALGRWMELKPDYVQIMIKCQTTINANLLSL